MLDCIRFLFVSRFSRKNDFKPKNIQCFYSGIIANDYADEIILDPKEIARQYVRSWFLLDLISSIPMDYIFWMLNKHENYNQILTAGNHPFNYLLS